ncbi:MAG TPA: glycosyl transferase family 90 [Burkholderiaceae bacterium]
MFDSLRAVADVWKFRFRMASALRDAAPRAAATSDELDHLVAVQTAYWEHRPLLAEAAAHQALRDLNDRSISAFVLSVRGQHVRLWNKSFPPEQERARRDEQRGFSKRALLYRAFIEKALRRSNAQASFDLALDVNDFPADAAELPIFSFQKSRGAHNPLLPDVDFFQCKWYREDHDRLLYEDKANSACFVGSSTGSWLDVEDIRTPETPRLRAAAHFNGNPRVMFRIANAVHCRSEEAKALLMSQPYFSSQVGWEEQLRHRFLISMDGNGAACSRLVKGLLSNSVVIKYDSPYDLYYFPALRPGSDYLLAEKDEDVERFVEAEAASPGSFKQVAQSGRRFADKYLTIGSVMDYTARLLSAFAALTRR